MYNSPLAWLLVLLSHVCMFPNTGVAHWFMLVLCYLLPCVRWQHGAVDRIPSKCPWAIHTMSCLRLSRLLPWNCTCHDEIFLVCTIQPMKFDTFKSFHKARACVIGVCSRNLHRIGANYLVWSTVSLYTCHTAQCHCTLVTLHSVTVHLSQCHCTLVTLHSVTIHLSHCTVSLYTCHTAQCHCTLVTLHSVTVHLSHCTVSLYTCHTVHKH